MFTFDSQLIRGRAGRPITRLLLVWLRAILERRRQRRALAALDDHLLWDTGVSREQALSEARRPSWR
ncbi:MAG: DUF1127 domain-containing protein [Geminicoccaceae bacterium]